MNKNTTYYPNYEPFLGGDDDPVIGYNQSYVSPKEVKDKHLDEVVQKHLRKKEGKEKNWNLTGVY